MNFREDLEFAKDILKGTVGLGVAILIATTLGFLVAATVIHRPSIAAAFTLGALSGTIWKLCGHQLKALLRDGAWWLGVDPLAIGEDTLDATQA